MVIYAYKNLETKRELIDAMNVFPVSDGDTGTNMWLTMKAVVQAINSDGDDPALDELLPTIARYSLLGARGNSGVILSQFFSGFTQSLAGKKTAHRRDLAEALKTGFKKAYETVTKPVEGTILTVMREVSVEANRFYRDDLVRWGHKILERAKVAQRKTREMLPALKQAGVTDAGGLGFVYVLEAFIAALQKRKIRPMTRQIKKLAIQTRRKIAKKLKAIPGYRYCFEFILRGIKVQIDVIKQRLVSLGDSLLIAKIKDFIHIHIHTNEPEQVKVVSSQFGEFSQLKLDDMTTQHRSFLPEAEDLEILTEPKTEDWMVLTIVTGRGLERIFKNLGANSILSSQGAVSIQELLAAVEAMPVKNILLIPNDGNVTLAAHQAQRLTKKKIWVIPTKTIPEGIGALLALNREEPLEANIEAMSNAITGVKSGMVSVAIRPSTGEGFKVKKGEFIGITDDTIRAKAKDPHTCLIELTKRMVNDESQLITVFYGAGIKKRGAVETADMLRKIFPKIEVQIYDGGQPVYHFLVGIS